MKSYFWGIHSTLVPHSLVPTVSPLHVTPDSHLSQWAFPGDKTHRAFTTREMKPKEVGNAVHSLLSSSRYDLLKTLASPHLAWKPLAEEERRVNCPWKQARSFSRSKMLHSGYILGSYHPFAERSALAAHLFPGTIVSKALTSSGTGFLKNRHLPADPALLHTPVCRGKVMAARDGAAMTLLLVLLSIRLKPSFLPRLLNDGLTF